ncbi:MAG: hypothetical protein KF723_21880 [Rhizobiaceae bacterium]|nr:hypothetical protein [Rhizobiaceae bacterium]
MINYEGFAVAVIIAFGALIIGGLMAANIAVADRDGFLFALGAAATAWLSGHAVLFNRPQLYGLLIAATALLCVASIVALVR